MMKRLLATLIASALMWACSDNASDTAGATSETTNGIAFQVVDAERAPIALARISLYSKADMVKLDSAVTDSDGVAVLAAPEEECYLEGIAGKDSALMAFASFDTTIEKVELLPSALIVVNIADLDSAALEKMNHLQLMRTPYVANFRDGAIVFAHVPSGIFNVVSGDSVVIEGVKVDAGGKVDLKVEPAGTSDDDASADTSATDATAQDSTAQDSTAQNTTARDTTERDSIDSDTSTAFIFEDFDDGDSLNNFAKSHPNYGWYVSEIGDAVFTKPSSITEFGQILDSSEERGKFLSVKFDLGDSGMVLIGSHIGEDTAYFDMSSLTAIRVTLRGDGDVSFALEHFEEVEKNHFNKALWTTKATDEWTEVEFKPGEEVVKPDAYQVQWDSVSKEIALFSIFASSGTFLEVDKIEFVGVNLK